jgi:cell division protein FtsW
MPYRRQKRGVTGRIAEATQLSLSWLGGSQGKKKSGLPDRCVLAITYVLLVLGLIMVFSASGIMAETRYGDSTYFLKRQGLWLVLGLIVMHVTANMDYHVWQRMAPYVMVGTGLLLLVVLIPLLGSEVKGARRWIRWGGVSLQPAEMAKVAVVIYLASFLSRKEGHVEEFRSGFLPPVVLVGGMAGLVLLEPDMGTAVVLGLVLVCLLFSGGARLSHLGGLVAVLLPLAAAVAYGSEYRRKRLLSFIDPWQDPMDTGFQLSQSFVALGSGGILGVGLGESKQKLFFLPEVHADFVLALIGEELGYVGTASLIVLFGFFVLKGFQISGKAPDKLGSQLALGVTLLVGGQALINAGVVAGLLPTKGLTLPLVSYGGSSLVVTLLGIGILLSVSRKALGSSGRSVWGAR